MKTKPRKRLRSLADRLSRLAYPQVCKLLGPQGKQWLTQGAKHDQIDIDRDVYLRGDLFRLTLPGAAADGRDIRVTISQMANRRDRLVWNCDLCGVACEHVGAAFALILEDKYALGLSEIPKEGVPLEHLSAEELEQRALAERTQRAREEKFRLASGQPDQPWTDYVITSGQSGKSYRVALRGEGRGDSFCSCPDFRVNTLGTCKHILYTLQRVRQKFSEAVRVRPFEPREYAVHLRYADEVTLWLQPPATVSSELRRMTDPFSRQPVEDIPALLACLQKLQRAGQSVVVYPDAEQWIQRRLFQQRIAQQMQQIRRDPASHPLRRTLLQAEMLPYQLDGVAFAVGAGRAVLADDMGLGKTIQGIGVAELLAQLAEIRRVLVICPASLKSQWRSEIQRFTTGRDCQIVLGSASERVQQYDSDCFFTICNYEQVLRDIQIIEAVKWDLIILDEGQRIKNWESKTSRVIKGLRSPFALVLSGTPLENRLDELYSVVQFIDDRRLPPAFRFFHRHRVVDDKGKVVGYKDLDQLRENLRPILLRRTRQSVLQDLPERTTEIVRIPASEQQSRISLENVAIAAQIAAKKFITEMDLLRIQKALLLARMAADSTYLVNKKHPSFSTKLDYLDGFFEQLFAEADRKAVLFSEWTTMLDLIEPLLEKHQAPFVRLDGSVPQKKRQQLVHRFQHDPSTRLFMATNAGSTGLNLQAANTVINIDLPWNPAVLEQRIARAHRMGQLSPVDVYVLVTEDTLEERILGTLADKQNLALAALDPDSQVDAVDFCSGMEEMKRRLESLLGAHKAAPVDLAAKQRVEQQLNDLGVHRERVAMAGGELLGAVFHFLGELVGQQETQAPPEHVVSTVRDRLSQCVEPDGNGRQRLTITLPDQRALDDLAQTLARLLVADNAG